MVLTLFNGFNWNRKRFIHIVSLFGIVYSTVLTNNEL